MQPQKIASLPLSLVSLPARDVYKHQYGGLLAHAHARNKILPPRILIAGGWISLLAFFCPDEQFTSGECVLPQKCCSTSASRKMGSYRRLFSFRKKLTNTRLSILGHHLTGGAPNRARRDSRQIFSGGRGKARGVGRLGNTRDDDMGDEKKKPLVVRPCFCPSERHGMTV